jgi:hypothetical protein
VHFDNLLFILLIAMAALLRLLASKAGESKKKSQQPGQTSTSTPRPIRPTPPRAPAESDEERIRKFLEALGQPTTSKPPPPVTPRTHIPPRPVAPVQPPPHMRPFAAPRWPTLEERPELQPRQKIPSAKPVPAVMAQPTAPQPAKVVIEERSGFPIREVTVLPPPLPLTAEGPITLPPLTSYETQTFAPTLDRSLSALLASPEGLRRAIILREIFGPPRSLQPLELVGSA